MNASPTSAPTPSQDSTWAPITMVAGILAILFGLVGLFSFGKSMFDILQMGGGFFFHYLLSSAVFLLMTIMGIVGGILLLNRNKIGWVLVMADSLSSLIQFIVIFFQIGQLPISFDDFSFWSMFYLLNLLFTVGFIVVFFLPSATNFLGIKGEHMGLAAGIGLLSVFLVYTMRYVVDLF